MRFKTNTTAVAIAAIAAFSLAAATVSDPPASHDAAVARKLNTFNALVKELELNYVDSIRTDEAFDAAIGAMLSTIDPYTEYYDSESRSDLMKMTTGEYGGIGSIIMERDGSTYISEPMLGSPAARAGLKAGDHIMRVDSTDVSRMGSSEVTRRLRGVPGTNVRIEVIRPYAADSVVVVDIERGKLVQPSVPFYGTVNDGRTGYLSLTSFIDKSPEEVRTALESFKTDPKVENMILDLRGNGGGLVESAVDIVGYFVPKGTEVVRTRGRDAASEKIYKTTRTPILPDMPLAVLIDGGSASASEITAGALQDLDRAVLIGTRSFGKGLVQSTRPLPYDGLLKVTVAKYYIPSGRLIQALDYSRRNPDGSVAVTPDSLTKVYHTSRGREVRDGGGLKPEITVDWGKASRLLYNVVRDFWAFDFATKYASEHPEIPSPSEFEITDSIYADFKRSIDPDRFKYDKVCEEMVKQLRETAEVEGYMSDSTKALIDSLAVSLTHNLQHDLDVARPEVSEYLAEEIVTRYYYEPGKIENRLKTDIGVKRAVEVLSDRKEYDRLLGKK